MPGSRADRVEAELGQLSLGLGGMVNVNDPDLLLATRENHTKLEVLSK